MQTFLLTDLDRALRPHDIPDDGVVMIHSSLLPLGLMDCVPPRALPTALLQGLRDLLGPQVTLVVPTFTFGFCQGELFDRELTPSRGMGAFSECLRRHPDALRSPHPIQSIAALGPRAQQICHRDTESAYGPGSAFESLLYLDATILLLGCSFEAISLVHLLEERQDVPYRCWRSFTAPYRDGRVDEPRTARFFVRRPDIPSSVHLAPIARLLLDRGQLQTTYLGAGPIQSCRALHFARAGLDLLRQDPRALLQSPPPLRYGAPS